MKLSRFPLALPLALLLLLTACAPGEQAAQPTPDAAPTQEQSEKAEGMDAIMAVMQDNVPFYCTSAGQELDLTQLDLAVGDEDADVKISAFTVADLDRDGMPEVLLWLIVDTNHSYGFQVLRWEEDAVRGYLVPYSSLVDLKADATFSFYNSAEDRGFGSMSFTGDSWAVEKTTWRSGSNYLVDGVRATEEAFLTAIQQQRAKNWAAWRDYSSSNISQYLLEDADL